MRSWSSDLFFSVPHKKGAWFFYVTETTTPLLMSSSLVFQSGSLILGGVKGHSSQNSIGETVISGKTLITCHICPFLKSHFWVYPLGIKSTRKGNKNPPPLCRCFCASQLKAEEQPAVFLCGHGEGPPGNSFISKNFRRTQT